jgi:hypothetical protein
MSFSSEALGKEEAKLIREDFEMSCRFYKSYKYVFSLPPLVPLSPSPLLGKECNYNFMELL